MMSSCRDPKALAAPRIRIAPSLLAADFGRLREELAMIEEAGADLIHLDIMDGHFVPNLSFGVPVVERIRGYSTLFFDTHVMITDPDRYAEPFIKAGSDNYCFHIEAAAEPRALIDKVHELGSTVGIALNPGTPAEAIDGVIDAVDLVLIMSVWPGFGGQSFISNVVPKSAELSRKLSPQQRLQFDGGIDATTVVDAARSGADTFVAGSAIFGAADPPAALMAIRKAAEGATQGRKDD